MKIVGGTYKKHGYGVYLGKYGTVMCSVAVEGDSRSHRNIWLTSMKRIKAKEEPKKPKSEKPSKPDKPGPSVPRGRAPVDEEEGHDESCIVKQVVTTTTVFFVFVLLCRC